jgi:CheY-like chemotaxis protein
MVSVSKDRSSLRILVVEDEPLLLLDLQEMLIGLGIGLVKACLTLEAATRSVEIQTFDIALLDVVVGRDTAIGLASDLHRRGTSVGFISGTDGNFIPEELATRPMLQKPYTSDEFKSFFHGLAG